MDRTTSQTQDIEDTPAPFSTALLLMGAIALGVLIGLIWPSSGALFSQGIDTTLLIMIFLLFFELRLGAIFKAFQNIRFLSLAWAANFLIIPIIAFGIASLFFSGDALLFTGLMIYFLPPCTDWFLGFTRLAKGDTELGAALIPINMITQLLLFPVWLWLFADKAGLVDFAAMPGTLLQWFILPLVAAQVIRFAAERLLPEEWSAGVLSASSLCMSIVLAALVFQLFAAHIGSVMASLHVVALVVLAVCLFFAATFSAGEILSRPGRLGYPQKALLSVTMAARNAPLMLALTAVAIPDQPLLLVVIVSGMLSEIPLLIILKQLLLRHSPER